MHANILTENREVDLCVFNPDPGTSINFSGIIVDASRLFASKTVVSGAGDLAMNAALAQYDKNAEGFLWTDCHGKGSRFSRRAGSSEADVL